MVSAPTSFPSSEKSTTSKSSSNLTAKEATSANNGGGGSEAGAVGETEDCGVVERAETALLRQESASAAEERVSVESFATLIWFGGERSVRFDDGAPANAGLTSDVGSGTCDRCSVPLSGVVVSL